MEHYKNLNIEDIDGEEWIDAIGYDGIYEVSNLGRVKSLDRWVSNGKSERLVKQRILSQALSKDGRLIVSFSLNNVQKSQSVSSLVYYSFNNKESYCKIRKEVVHLDKIQTNNNLFNLSLMSCKESKNIANNLGKLNFKGINNFNFNKSQKYKTLKVKRCTKCKEKKDFNKFDYGRRKCKECRNIERNLKNAEKRESKS